MTDRRQIWPCRGLADSDNDVDWTKLITQLTEYFSNNTLHQGTCNRARRRMPPDDYSQAGLIARWALSAQNDEKFALPPCRKRTGKLRFAAQPRLARQSEARRL